MDTERLQDEKKLVRLEEKLWHDLLDTEERGELENRVRKLRAKQVETGAGV